MAQQLRALEDPGPIASTHMLAHSGSSGSAILFRRSQALTACGAYSYM